MVDLVKMKVMKVRTEGCRKQPAQVELGRDRRGDEVLCITVK